MRIRINTQVPSCPKCGGALDRGFRNTDHYKGTYYFCVDCHISFEIVGQGQSENELEFEWIKETEDDTTSNIQ